ncbi:hypothetical protein CRYUN_Cryun18bG0021200 [Craigia yunnanensis]
MAKPNSDVPQDITDQILPCLPVKSLMRFKCVCKSWSSLITSPPFARNHFKRASLQNPKTIDLKLLILLPCGFKYLDLAKSFDEGAALIRFRFWPNGYKLILGSCNGLVCLGLENIARCLLLWNPSTGESKVLPNCNLLQDKRHLHFHYYGFGYDSSSGDYKLLLMIDRKIVIFSVMENSWKIMHKARWPWHGYSCYTKGVYSNGALHWQDHHGDIYAFDLKIERFRLGPSPDASMLGRRQKLCGAGETLYSIKEVKNSMDVEYWLLEKYWFHRSWTKVHNFPGSYDFCYFLEHFLCISKGNEFITENGEDIIRFDAEGGIVEQIRMCNSPSRCEAWNRPHLFDAITYEETLVSPNRGNNLYSAPWV